MRSIAQSPVACRCVRLLLVAAGAVAILGFAANAFAQTAAADSAAAAASRLSDVSAESWLSHMLPRSIGEREVLGVLVWQWVGLLILIFLGFLADYGVRALTRPVIRRVSARFYPDVDKDQVTRVARALGLFAGAVVWLVLVRLLDLSGNVRDVARTATGFYTVLTATLMGLRFVDLLGDVLMHVASSTSSKIDDIMVPLIRKTAKVFVFAMGVVYGAQNLSINIVPLITGLGIGGLAFAFAAKDTIENFFGSIAVILDHPFVVGDWVVVGDTEGVVEELGFRSTRVRTFYNSQVTIPNAALVRATVDNYGRRRYRRWKTYLGVQYDTPPEKLLAFTEGIRELVRQHPYTRKDFYQVWCNDFADFSLNILLYVFFEVPDWSTELRERERLFVDIVRLADKLGVVFAFPTQTVHLYKEEHAPHESQYQIPRGAHDTESAGRGAEVARDITANRDWQEKRPGPVQFEVGRSKRRDRETGGS